jgi:hypothetical protein
MGIATRASCRLLIAVVLSACGSREQPVPPAPAPIASIELAAASDYLLAGSTLQLSATPKDAQGQAVAGRSLTWSSSAPGVLTVGSTGLVSGVSQGNATVTVSAEGHSNSISLAVTVLALIRVTAPTFVLQPGGATQLTAVVLDSASHEISTPVTWSSASEAIASVSASGRVTAIAEGATSILVAAGSVTGSLPIAVQQPIRGKIAFVSRRGPVQNATQQGGIYLMNPDGTQQQLVMPDVLDWCNPDPPFTQQCYIPWQQPALTSDGLRLATVRLTIYAIEFSGDMIFECATAGTPCLGVDYPQVPPRPAPVVALAGVGDPAWSPDGGRIAFTAAGEIGLWDSATGVVSEVSATAPVAGAQPAWSPDGTRLAFASRGSSRDIWVVNLDGSHLVNLTNNAGENSQPTWSPDGTRIAFVSNREGNDEIYVMSIDGSSQINLTHNAASDTHPSWSPDSTKIAFQTNRDGNNEIYAMDADGSNQVNLTNDPADDSSPSWGP